MPQLKALVDAGDLSAARVLGERYQHGDGVPVDMKQAVRWYEQAAFIPPSTTFIYMPGYGKVPGSILPVPANQTKTGDAVAIAHLGQLYIEGRAVPFDEVRGRQLLSCAAQRGVESDLVSLRENDNVVAESAAISVRHTGKIQPNG